MPYLLCTVERINIHIQAIAEDHVMFCRSLTGERTVKRLRLSKALTIPDHTTVYEACRRMASRRVDAVLLTDSNALLCGILTDKVGMMPLRFT